MATKRYYLYNPQSSQSFKISRSKIDLFMECPRCFYLDRRLGIPRPSMPGFSLNSAVDQLLKNEFDLLREKGQAHKIMKQYQIEAIPFKHKDLPIWRDDIRHWVGASVLHKPTNLIITGIIDDIWINKKEELLIVDYKSTSTEKEISLEDKYKQGYKKQIEVYQWIFKKMGFPVSDMGYFVYANAGKNRASFDGKLEFTLSILSYKGDVSWVEPTIFQIKICLDSDSLPSPSSSCEYCSYLEKRRIVFGGQ
ncbi:hypothetical protein A2Y99_01340 [Candidatus Gottesmanbacteria bacterium RBG_13_37_7]|uniref:PD-(D/E)XK endonuclease-like domain-containing protein n=1 Tax=Candidatus Gottesmanbacteria bacterium RBG_13_37_7 TaxID=1798369 RepID=A0A1F5YHU7_9BACT|nr:MAG: hypothetical protein A2Y99_01340 [Candidatus Gottesmanbacteria bacterium RBG_13_37_7]